MSDAALIVDPADAPPAPAQPASWRWRFPGAALVASGLISATGAYLRWWGPFRLNGVAARENDDASPLHMGWSFHQHPGSGELWSIGQIVVAVALLLLILLPWRDLVAKLVAWPTLVVGAVGVAFRPAVWLGWVALGRPTAGFPGWSPSLPAWVETAGFAAEFVWGTGLAGLLLVVAAARAARSTPQTLGRSMLLPAMATLILGAMLIEFVVLSVLFLSDTHDDPIGLGVAGGLATAVAGSLLVWTVEADARGSSDADGAHRSRRWWVIGGAVLAVGGALMLVVTRLVPPALYADVTTTGRWVSIVASLLAPLGYVALAAGPWRGARRPIAAVLAAFGVLAPLVGAGALVFGTDPALSPDPFGRGVGPELQAPVWGTGHLFVPFALLLVWEWGNRTTLRRWSGIAMVTIAVGAVFASEIYEDAFVLDVSMDTADALVVRSLLLGAATVVVGLGWCLAGLVPETPTLEQAGAAQGDADDPREGGPNPPVRARQ